MTEKVPYSRVEFTRDFPVGCGNLSSFSSSSLNKLVSYTRDFPAGCGPNATKLPNDSGRVLNSGFTSVFKRPSDGLKGNIEPGSGFGSSRMLVKKSSKVVFLGSEDKAVNSGFGGCGPNATKLPNDSGRAVNSGFGGCGPNATKLPNDSGRAVNSGFGGCGPNATKLPNDSSRAVNSGFGGGSSVLRRPFDGLKGKIGSGSGVSRMMVRKPSKVVFLGSEDEGKGKMGVSGVKDEGKMAISAERKKVNDLLEIFRKRCDELAKKGNRRVDLDAEGELTRERKIWKQPSLMSGGVPGVEVGDTFYYRVELAIVGLQRKYQAGIDYMEYAGDKYATCIVANEGHLDKMGDPNALSYIGEGGTLKQHQVGVPPDQELMRGNLALDNSRKGKKPVRVVRGIRYGSGNAKIVYVYDGLYEVVETIKKKGPHGNVVFEFRMTRNLGQPVVPWKEYRRRFA